MLNDEETPEKVQEKFPKTNWTEYLKILEKQEQILSIKKMHKKITRLRKELEFWQKSQEEKPKEAEAEKNDEGAPQVAPSEDKPDTDKNWIICKLKKI